MFRLFVLFLLFSINAADERIVGGKNTTIEEFPHQVSVLYIFRHICGGSIINKNTVITAAHCTSRLRPFTVQIRAGTTYKDSKKAKGMIFNVDKILLHPNFTLETIDCDISILKLKQSVVFSPQIQPILLQQSNEEIPENAIVTVTGWGLLRERGKSSNNLQKVNLKTITKSECMARYSGKITDHMFCSQDSGKDACQGDSGGPVVYNGRLVGIVSWGIGCARPEYPGVFTKISSLRLWIDQVLNKNQ